MENIAGFGQQFFKGRKVFDDAIVHHHQPSRIGSMRMRIGIVGFAMGRPTRVADAHGCRGRRAHNGFQVCHFAFAFEHIQMPVKERYPSRIVAAVF